MIAKLVQFSLKYKLLMLILFLTVCSAGALSFTRMSIDAFPDISPNLVQVFAEVEGMAAEECEQFVTRPVEVIMRGIPGVTKIRSLSSLGLATINIYFDDKTDIYRSRQLVSERLKEAEEAIPEGVMPHGLKMGAIVSGMGKILGYYLEAGDYDITELRTLQEWIVKRELQTVPGVAKVISQGGHVRQYQIKVDPDLLTAYNLTLDEVVAAVRRNNHNLGAGIIERGSEELIVRSLGLLGSLDDLKNTVITTREKRPIFISDIATVEKGKAFRRGVSLLNADKEIVSGTIYKTHGANSFAVIGEVKKRLEKINRSLPQGVKVVTYYDQADLVKNSINTVRNALSLGLLMISIVTLIFLRNWRNSLVVVGALPFATLFAATLLYYRGIPGDLLSFGGIAIALGMIVDATIIMVERLQSAFATTTEKASPGTLILRAAQEVATPIFFASAIIIIVFLPIFTLGEVEGKMFRPLAIAVTATMIGALIYALMIAPVLFRLLRPKNSQQNDPDHSESALVQRYRTILNYFLERRWLVTLIIVALLFSGGLTFAKLGKEFVPTLEEGTLQSLAYMNPNISLEEITTTAKEMAKEMKAFPEVKEVVVDIGYGEVGPHMHHTNYACMNITLQPKNKWQTTSSQDELIELIDQRIKDFPGVSTTFSQPIKHEIDGLIGGAGSSVVAKLFGDDFDALLEKAAEISEVLAHIEGVADLRTEQVDGQTQLQITIKPEAGARHGLSKDEVQRTISRAIAGETVGRIFKGERMFDITVRFNKASRNSIDAVKKLLLKTPGGYNVPLEELAEIETVSGLRQISREDTRRYISIQSNVRGRDSGSFVDEAQRQIAEKVVLPPGYHLAWGGQFELRQAANKRLLMVIPLTLLLVMVMLYGLFNSLSNVVLVMLNIPLALVGGVISLAIFQENLSIPSSIGFIALFGIALTDGLVLISRFEHLKSKGYDLRKRVLAGCSSKLRPVLITTITTAVGLLPLIFSSSTGSEIQRPLAVVVVGGLFSSTLLTLIVIPTLYEQFAERWRKE
ncbi:MAG: CusA/CzcA family heavy metal efflux RND transporter [Pseudomonadota bacterium]|nr:CusA/CzcA family heavy metal efflux RND transporter [Pseudomonadota bacterium]